MLAGVKILEIGQYIAAPVTGMLLADLGAEVIKIERPGGDPIGRLPAYHTWNRGKRVVEIDLASAEGRTQAERLIAGADVVIDGLAPGVLSRFGLGLGRISAERRDLITCTLPGFATELGLDDFPAWDPLITALAGGYGPTAEGELQFNGLPFASIYAAIVAANSIAAALFVRARSGLGQGIEVPIHSAYLLAAGFRLVRLNGEPPVRVVSNPLVATYRCADGRWIQLHVATPKFVDGFIGATGTSDWWEEGLFDRGRWAMEPHLMAMLEERLAAMFLQHPSDEWEERFSTAGLCCVKCRTVEEWIRHPHSAASGLVVELQTELGPMLQPGPIAQGEHAAAPQPLVRESATASWTSPPTPERARTNPPAHALDGIRVVDLCVILAGPTCARVLAEFGADVIKVDGRAPTVTESFWIDTNRGKRSIVVDLKTEGGREIMWRLVETADVVVENFRRGVVERLGLGYEQVSARFPRIVYASMNAYGYRGPMAGRPGWEQMAQATTGMQVRAGGRSGTPQNAHYAINDYASGLAASLAVLAALAQRERTGRGQHVTTALTATAGMFQSLSMLDYPGHINCDVEGPDATGWNARSRAYRCADGWIFVHSTAAAWEGMLAQTRLGAETPGSAAGTVAALEGRLEAAFGAKPADEWVACLNQAGATAVKLRNSDDLHDWAELRTAGLLRSSASAHLGDVEHFGIAQRLSLTPAQNGRPAPALGGDTIEILRELGYADLQIGRWFGERVIATYAR